MKTSIKLPNSNNNNEYPRKKVIRSDFNKALPIKHFATHKDQNSDANLQLDIEAFYVHDFKLPPNWKLVGCGSIKKATNDLIKTLKPVPANKKKQLPKKDKKAPISKSASSSIPMTPSHHSPTMPPDALLSPAIDAAPQVLSPASSSTSAIKGLPEKLEATTLLDRLQDPVASKWKWTQLMAELENHIAYDPLWKGHLDAAELEVVTERIQRRRDSMASTSPGYADFLKFSIGAKKLEKCVSILTTVFTNDQRISDHSNEDLAKLLGWTQDWRSTRGAMNDLRSFVNHRLKLPVETMDALRSLKVFTKANSLTSPLQMYQQAAEQLEYDPVAWKKEKKEIMKQESGGLSKNNAGILLASARDNDKRTLDSAQDKVPPAQKVS